MVSTMRTRRLARFGTALATLTLVLSGCGGQPSAGGLATVQFLTFGDPQELAAYRTLITAYEASTPGAHVQLIEASDRNDLITRLTTSIGGGAPPDTFLINYRFYGQFAARGTIEPLDERLRASQVVRTADYYPVAMNAFRWQGRQLCLPQNVSSLVVYYNRALFAKYGVAEPKPGWTWHDMVTAAKALTRDANGAVISGGDPDSGQAPGSAAQPAVYGLGVDPEIIRLAPFIWSNGGQIVDDPQKPARLALDSPQAKEALRNFLDLRLALGVVPTDDQVEAENDESRFANGRLAMLMQSRRVTTTFRTIAGLDWDIASLPSYRDPASVLHSDAFCMTAGSAHKDSAWRFLEFAIGEQGQRILAGTGRTVPSHIGVSRSSAFLDPAVAPHNAQVFLDVIPTVRTLPLVSTWPEIEDVVNGILENAFYGGGRLSDIVSEMETKTQPIFARGVAG